MGNNLEGCDLNRVSSAGDGLVCMELTKIIKAVIKEPTLNIKLRLAWGEPRACG